MANFTPKTYDEKLARVTRKIHKAIQDRDADEYFWHLVDWAFLRAGEKDSRENLTFLKDVSLVLDRRTQPKDSDDLAELVNIIKSSTPPNMQLPSPNNP